MAEQVQPAGRRRSAALKFYVDDNLSDKLAQLGRAAGLDIVHSKECGLWGEDDAVHLAFAAGE